MAIKVASGKLSLAQPISSFVDSQVALYNFHPLLVTHEQTYQIATMILLRHKDPFDRILAAQALLEDLILLTRDPEMSQYGVKILW